MFSTALSKFRFEPSRQGTKPYRSAKRRITSSASGESTELLEEAKMFDHRSSRSEWIRELGSDDSIPAVASQTHNNLTAKPSER